MKPAPKDDKRSAQPAGIKPPTAPPIASEPMLVVISAPSKGEDIMVVLGVNFDDYDKDAQDTKDVMNSLQRAIEVRRRA